MKAVRSLVAGACAVVLAVSGAAPAVATAPCDVVVDGGPHYASLTAALDSLSDGGHHLLVAGECVESVNIESKGLHIEGTAGARVVVPTTSPDSFPMALSIWNSEDVWVSDLTIVGHPSGAAGVVFDSHRVGFDRCTFTDSQYGLWVSDSAVVDLQDSVVRSCDLGVRVDGQSRVRLVGTGQDPSGLTVVEDNYTGVYLHPGTLLNLRGGVLLQNNLRIAVAAQGASIMTCCIGDPVHPRIVNNGASGFWLTGSHLKLLAGAYIEDNGDWGIALLGSTATLQPEVYVRGNARGIVGLDSFLQLYRTQVTANAGDGIVLYDNSSARLIAPEIRDNGGVGVDVQSLSVAAFYAGAIVEGNGKLDLRCSPNSHGRGDDSGIGRSVCPGFDNGPSPLPGGPDG